MSEIPALPEKEFFSIGEVSQLLQIKPYVLRYWESEFKTLHPQRRISGQRKYTKKDIELLFSIKELLYTKKFTIAGARKTLAVDRRKKDNTNENQLNLGIGTFINPQAIREIRSDIEAIVKILKQQ
ncbi:MAG: MerR family transcriptional regulator [Endomicrobiales bacterium]|nr:MerR family transcriptional regulator [Endomicrobiales bacterium]